VPVNEIQDIYGLRRGNVGAAKVLVVEKNVIAFLVLVTLDDVLGFNGFACPLVDSLVAHRRVVTLVYPVEIQALGLRCRVDHNGDVNQAKRYGAFPDGARHDGLLRLPGAKQKAYLLRKRGRSRLPFALALRLEKGQEAPFRGTKLTGRASFDGCRKCPV